MAAPPLQPEPVAPCAITVATGGLLLECLPGHLLSQLACGALGSPAQFDHRHAWCGLVGADRFLTSEFEFVELAFALLLVLLLAGMLFPDRSLPREDSGRGGLEGGLEGDNKEERNAADLLLGPGRLRGLLCQADGFSLPFIFLSTCCHHPDIGLPFDLELTARAARLATSPPRGSQRAG